MKARHVLVAAVAAAALAGCSGGASADQPAPGELDDAAIYACTDFAKGYKAAVTRSARLDLSNKVNKWARTSRTDRIADMGQVLGRGANGSDEAWQLGADAFAKTCTDAGWDAENAS